MRFLIVSLLLALVLVPQTQLHAQQDRYWRVGCDDRIRDNIASTSDVLDYNAACETYVACTPTDENTVEEHYCQLQVLKILLDQCPAGDTHCADGAALFAAAIYAFPDRHSPEPPQHVVDDYPVALDTFWAEDYQTALEVFLSLPQLDRANHPDDYYNNLMVYISSALLQHRLGQSDAAFESLRRSYELVPLLLYLRAQMYGGLGRIDEASFDVESLRLYFGNEPDIMPLIAHLQAQYPLDESALEDWLLYPTSRVGGTNIGDVVVDQTMEPPRPVRLGRFPDLNAVVVMGLEQFQYNSLNPIMQPLYRVDGQSYSARYELRDSNFIISLTQTGETFEGYNRIHYPSEISEENHFILAPVAAEDPRTDRSGIRHCEGGVLSRVAIGQDARTVFAWTRLPGPDPESFYSFEGTPYHHRPDTRSIVGVLPAWTTLTIIGGPECVDQETWWQIGLEDGSTGWIAEDRGGIYFLQPLPEE